MDQDGRTGEEIGERLEQEEDYLIVLKCRLLEIKKFVKRLVCELCYL